MNRIRLILIIFQELRDEDMVSVLYLIKASIKLIPHLKTIKKNDLNRLYHVLNNLKRVHTSDGKDLLQMAISTMTPYNLLIDYHSWG